MSIVKKFKKYVKCYDISDVMIRKKLFHSIRVMKIARILAKKLGLSKENVEIAKIIGLLHDYARFEQWTQYHTYSDLESVDHGDLAVLKLFENYEIKDFYQNEDNYQIINDSIKYHNKFDYPDDLDEINKLHVEIIRDADKLDIFYIIGSGINKPFEDKEPISKIIEKDFFDNKLGNRKNVKNDSDNLIITLSMIYDLNFRYSFFVIDKNKFIWKIYDQLNDKEKFKKYFEYIDNYIKERLK